MELNQPRKLTKLHKLHLRCHIINVHMQRLFNSSNRYLPILITNNRDKVHQINLLRFHISINVRIIGLEIQIINIVVRINVNLQTGKK